MIMTGSGKVDFAFDFSKLEVVIVPEVQAYVRQIIADNSYLSSIWIRIVNNAPEIFQRSKNKELLFFVFVFILTGFAISVTEYILKDDNDIRKKYKNCQVALNQEEWTEFPLLEKEEISHDVRRFRFGLQSKDHIIGLPIGQHISFKFVDKQGKDVIRSYTPTTSNDEAGYVDFVIKVYFKNVHPKFPDGGKMSQYLNDLKVGQKLLMKGPKGHLDYIGRGRFTITQSRDEVGVYRMKKIGMIAGGTGITPMLQVIRAILKDPQDKTEIWLIFANQTEEDILLRKELEAIPKERFHLWYTLDRPPTDGSWKYSSGFINTDMCREHLPPPSKDAMIFCCGPPPMIKFACEPAFKEIGYVEKQWFSF